MRRHPPPSQLTPSLGFPSLTVGPGGWTVGSPAVTGRPLVATASGPPPPSTGHGLDQLGGATGRTPRLDGAALACRPPSTGSPLAARSPATARARGSLSAGAGPDAIATAMPTATSSGQRGIEASGPLPRLGERPANVNGLDRPPRPPMARGGLAASTGPARPGPPPRRAHPPAPDRREGGEARRRPAPPPSVRSLHAPAPNFELRGDTIGRSVPSAWVTAVRPKPDRAQLPPHPVRAITRIWPLCPPRVPPHPPASGVPRGPETPRKEPEGAGIGGEGGCARAAAQRFPRPIPA